MAVADRCAGRTSTRRCIPGSTRKRWAAAPGAAASSRTPRPQTNLSLQRNIPILIPYFPFLQRRRRTRLPTRSPQRRWVSKTTRRPSRTPRRWASHSCNNNKNCHSAATLSPWWARRPPSNEKVRSRTRVPRRVSPLGNTTRSTTPPPATTTTTRGRVIAGSSRINRDRTRRELAPVSPRGPYALHWPRSHSLTCPYAYPITYQIFENL